MPTGYTAPIYEGKDITFAQFAMRCARAFGYLVQFREDSLDAVLPQEITPGSSYYVEALARDEAELRIAEKRTDTEWKEAAAKNYEKAWATDVAAREQKYALCERYSAMLDKVRAWGPPTTEHESLKDFMEEQLKESMRFECSDWPAPTKKTWQEYKADTLARLRSSVKRDKEEIAEEKKRTKETNAWLKALRESLGGNVC